MQTFRTPFSRAYWKAAAAELRNTRMLLLAALAVALRVALKSVSIPVGENLYITVGFLPNALGSMVYGPVVGLLSGAASDLIGVLLFPKGPFFPPFMLVEMLGSLLFALFLYRAKLTISRVALSKLSVNILCNILITPLLLAWMNGKAAVLASMPRIIKNVVLFPLESVLLAVFLSAMLPILSRMGIHSGQAPLKLSARHFVLLALLFLLSVLAVFLYYELYL